MADTRATLTAARARTLFSSDLSCRSSVTYAVDDAISRAECGVSRFGSTSVSARRRGGGSKQHYPCQATCGDDVSE
jgi:hypothetical protein